MQLVGPNIKMFDPMKNKDIGVEDVIEKFGVGPQHVVDVQALAEIQATTSRVFQG